MRITQDDTDKKIINLLNPCHPRLKNNQKESRYGVSGKTSACLQILQQHLACILVVFLPCLQQCSPLVVEFIFLINFEIF